MGMQPQKPSIASPPLLISPPRSAQGYGQPPCTVSLPTHTHYPSKLQQRYSNDWTQTQCCTDKLERNTASGASNALAKPPGCGKSIAAFFSFRLRMPTCEVQPLPACERLRRKAVRQEYMARAKHCSARVRCSEHVPGALRSRMCEGGTPALAQAAARAPSAGKKASISALVGQGRKPGIFYPITPPTCTRRF